MPIIYLHAFLPLTCVDKAEIKVGQTANHLSDLTGLAGK
jgi:hypothetical protein